ncbi:hypothetical protein TWF506_005819 [Arthrobotrys conoides]|uniref:Uncharacterized protein n=1 Tax=Arthrobotrys conoides TaxID=74498 RepID=A0AAN8RX45_9PEZI
MSLTTLPLELKLQVISYITSTHDVNSLINSCCKFRMIKYSKYWPGIKKTVLNDETRENITAELVTLWKLREAKKVEGYTGFQSIPTTDLETLIISLESPDIDALSTIRKTIKWYIKRFYKPYLREEYPASNPFLPPSSTILKNLERSFSNLWLVIEANSDPIVSYRCANRAPILDWEVYKISQEIYEPASTNKLGRLYGLIEKELVELGEVCKERLVGRYKSKLEFENKYSTEKSFYYWLDSFTKWGLPRLILLTEKLDGVKNALKSSEEERMKFVEDFFGFDILDDSYLYFRQSVPWEKQSMLVNWLSGQTSCCDIRCFSRSMEREW